MIHYALRCSCQHEFDGWFKDSTTFERLAAAGSVVCPVCDGTEVDRALMAPAVASGARNGTEVVDAPSGGEAAPAPLKPPASPDAMRRMLQEMRRQVEQNCTYVGAEFADEARRIHRGEAEARGIYGEATPDEAERLADEGIEVAQIPWLPPAH